MTKFLAGFCERLDAREIAGIQSDRRLSRNGSNGGEKRLDPVGKAVGKLGDGVSGSFTGKLQDGFVDAVRQRGTVDFSQVRKPCSGSLECLHCPFELGRCLGPAGGTAFFHAFRMALVKADLAALLKTFRAACFKIDLRGRGCFRRILVMSLISCFVRGADTLSTGIGFTIGITGTSQRTGRSRTGVGLCRGIRELTGDFTRGVASSFSGVILDDRAGRHRGAHFGLTATLRRHGNGDKRTRLEGLDRLYRDPIASGVAGVVRQGHQALDFRIFELACGNVFHDAHSQTLVEHFLICVAG